MGDELRKISKEDLERILDEHKVWLESDGINGNWADLSNAELKRVDLSGADLSEADLSGADLSLADLSEADLSRASLSWAYLERTSLYRACAKRASLVGVNLSRADLSQADLSQVSLNQAYLNDANLKWDNLNGADLSWADLSGADLSGADLTGADFAYAKLVKTKASNRAQLASAKNIEDYSGFIFEEDELKQEKENREKRAENIFDVNEKGTISFSIPSTLPPLHVAQVLICLTVMAEGVRLAFTADYETPEQLGRKVANPALWTGKEEKYAARISALNLRNPIEGSFLIIGGIGYFLGKVLQHGAPVLESLLKHRRDTEFNRKHFELENRKLDIVERSLPIVQADELSGIFKDAAASTVSELPEEVRKIAGKLVEHLAGKVDKPEERTAHATEITLRSFDKLISLLRDEDAKLGINDTDIDLRERKADDYPEAENEQNPTGKPEE